MAFSVRLDGIIRDVIFGGEDGGQVVALIDEFLKSNIRHVVKLPQSRINQDRKTCDDEQCADHRSNQRWIYKPITPPMIPPMIATVKTANNTMGRFFATTITA